MPSLIRKMMMKSLFKLNKVMRAKKGSAVQQGDAQKQVEAIPEVSFESQAGKFNQSNTSSRY